MFQAGKPSVAFPANRRALAGSEASCGVAVMEYAYAARTFLPDHAHASAALCCTLRGDYNEQYGRRVLRCGGENVIFRPATEGHSDRFGDAAAHCLVVEFPAEWMRRAEEFGVSLREPMAWRAPRMAALLRQLHREYRREDLPVTLTVEGLAWQILAEATPMRRERACASRQVEAVRELLHAEFAEPPAMAKLAELAGLHPSHLSRVFRERYGCSMTAYLRHRRIESAWESLTRSDEPIVHIAHRAGFAHQSHFTAAFKRETGQTPAQVRRLSRKSIRRRAGPA